MHEKKQEFEKTQRLAIHRSQLSPRLIARAVLDFQTDPFSSIITIGGGGKKEWFPAQHVERGKCGIIFNHIKNANHIILVRRELAKE